jgi:hypothetical protein
VTATGSRMDARMGCSVGSIQKPMPRMPITGDEHRRHAGGEREPGWDRDPAGRDEDQCEPAKHLRDGPSSSRSSVDRGKAPARSPDSRRGREGTTCKRISGELHLVYRLLSSGRGAGRSMAKSFTRRRRLRFPRGVGRGTARAGLRRHGRG